MAEDVQPPENTEKGPEAENSDEISLEDIDKILEEDDPGFSQSLEEVREAAEETDVEIESLDIDAVDLESEEEGEVKRPSRLRQLVVFRAFSAIKDRARLFCLAFINRSKMFAVHAKDWLRVRPREYLGYAIAQLKRLLAWVRLGIESFKKWSWSQKIVFLAFLGFLFLGSGFLFLNFKGRWVPTIDKPLIADFGSVAEKSWSTKGESFVPLFQALRQPEHRYLFEKVVVNLRRPEFSEDSNPMGLFEFYVELDARSTAIEVKARERELLDLLQRTIEGETYNSLTGEPGKQRLKNLIRQELNQVLNQGWVKDVYISNMVLKP